MSLQSTDPVADLLTRIRNAAMVGKNEIRVPSSKLKKAVAKELVRANYLESVETESAKPRDILVVKINKDGENIAIEIKGRHDPIVVARAVVVVECMTALVLADALLVGMSAKLDNVKKVWAPDEK